MAGDPSREPSADQRTAAASIRGLFLALTAEGFTTFEALTLLGQMFIAYAPKTKPEGGQ